MQVGNCYEKNGYTIQIDRINNNQVYYAKYKCHIGDYGTWDNFCGFFRIPINAFKNILIDKEIKKEA